MIRLFFFISFIMAGISVIAQSSNNYNNEWQLIWQDEFNEETLNEAKWSKIPRGKSEWNKYMSEIGRASCRERVPSPL